MTEPAAIEYRAFISYSHTDTRWAKWLQRSLESFRIAKDIAGRKTAVGTVPESLRPIFRDRYDFTVGHALTEQTRAALDASAALIVICSPAAVGSQYVNEEIRLFKSQHPERPVLPMIVDGVPDNPERECFPPALRFKVSAKGRITKRSAEVLAADIREESDGKNLALAKIVAGLLGVPSDEVFRRAERERRRKKRVRSAVVAVLALLVGIGGYATWDSYRKGETIADQEQRHGQALVIAQKLLGASPAAAAVPGIKDNLIAALTALEEQASRGDADAQKALELTKAGREDEAVELLRAAAEKRKERGAEENRESAKLYRRAAALAGVSDLKQAREYYAEAAQLDPDNIDGLLQHATFQSLGGSLDDAEAAYRRVITRAEEKQDERSAMWAHMGLGTIRLVREDLPTATAEFDAAAEIARRGVEDEPENLDWQGALAMCRARAGGALKAQGKFDEALEAYEDGLAISDRLSAAQPDNVIWQGNQATMTEGIGDLLIAKGDLVKALDAYRLSVEISRRLAERDPSNDTWQMYQATASKSVGDVLKLQGNLSEALKSYRDVASIYEIQSKEDPTNSLWNAGMASAYQAIGDARQDQGNFPEALEAYRQALDIIERQAKADPNTAVWQSSLLWASVTVGDALVNQGKFGEALSLYEDRLEDFERMAKEAPNSSGRQRNLAAAYERIGDVLKAQGDLPGALKRHNESLAIRDKMAAAYPEDVGWQRDLTVSHTRLGDVLRAQGKHEEAFLSYDRNRAMVERLAKSDPSNTKWQDDVAWAHSRIGDVLKAKGKHADALASYRKSLEVRKPLAESDPTNVDWQNAQFWNHVGIGDMLRRQGQFYNALSEYQAGLRRLMHLDEIAPDSAEQQRNLSIIYERTGDIQLDLDRPDDAKVSFERRLEIASRLAALDPSNVNWQKDLAISHGRVALALFNQGDMAGALPGFRKARGIIARLREQFPDNATLPDLAWYDEKIETIEAAGVQAQQPDAAP